LGGGLSKEDLLALANACKENGIEFIPMINCLGHQSWEKHTSALLTKYPEFDETPGKYPDNEDIYCRSYCPYHPDVHNIIFALIDELCEVTDAKSFHVGLDETFILADEDCPRCGDKTPAEAFAHEVNTLHDHLAKKGIKMWMWGDRFLDGEVTDIGKWEASGNDTAPAINMVPKDIVICDWHYEKPHPTMIHFALEGFDVLPSPWRQTDVALGQLELIRLAKKSSSDEVSARFKGMLHTTWCGMAPFVRAYHGEERENNKSAYETVECFKALYDAMN
jgi:N-acetyl-beta-hexosaminidase